MAHLVVGVSCLGILFDLGLKRRVNDLRLRRLKGPIGFDPKP